MATTTTTKPESQNFWGRLWILNRIVRVGHIYSFLSFYSIRSHTLCFFLNWHVLFTTSINVTFGLLLIFFCFSTWINSLFLISVLITLFWTWPNQLRRLYLIFSSIGAILIFKWISSFEIMSFCVFPVIHVKILNSDTRMNMFQYHTDSCILIKFQHFYCIRAAGSSS